jgi:hypothetical protein
MTKQDAVEGTRVVAVGRRYKEYGAGSIDGLLPDEGNFVHVQFDSGKAFKFPIEQLAEIEPPKPTRIEKYYAQVEAVRVAPISYYVAGWLVGHRTDWAASAPEGEQTSAAIDELVAVGMWEGQPDITHGENLAVGRCYSATTEDFGSCVADSLAAATTVAAPLRGLGATTRALNAKQFYLDFLGGDLNFKRSKVQDAAHILSRVPAIFRPVFEQGMRGEKI